MVSFTREDQKNPAKVVPDKAGGAQHWVRLLVITPIFALGLVMYQGAQSGLVENSISAYHGGPFRDVFVAGLVGTAIALAAYWGVTPIEDYALNMAAFYAFFVAVVPWNIGEVLASASDPDSPLGDRFVLKIIIGCFVGTGVLLILADLVKGSWSPGWIFKGSGAAARTCQILGGLSLLALILYISNVFFSLGDPTTTFSNIHFPAAVLLFAHLGVAVLAHAFNLMPQPVTIGSGFRHFYKVIFALMVAACVVAAVARGESDSWVLWLELAEVVLFAAFWVSEIVRFWNVPESSGRGPDS